MSLFRFWLPFLLQVKKGTELGKEIEGIMKEGKLVPTDITVKLLREAMQKSTADMFLIDGFPREIHQAHAFEREVKPPQLVIYYDCPKVTKSAFGSLEVQSPCTLHEFPRNV